MSVNETHRQQLYAVVAHNIGRPLPPSGTIFYNIPQYLSGRRWLQSSSAFVSCPEVGRTWRTVCKICVSASFYCYPCTSSKTSRNLAEETTVRVIAYSLSAILLICHSALSSLSTMYPEHAHHDLLFLLLAFSHLSKRPQRNGIRH